MYRGLKKSLRLPKQLNQTIDSVHISFGKNGIMRFILDKWFETTFLSTVDNWVKKCFFGNK